MKHNAHVKKYYRWMHWLSRETHRPLSQLYWYTQDQKEDDINWRPEHVRKGN